MSTHSHKTLEVPSPVALGPVTPEEAQLLEKLDLQRLPRHLAVIMDGKRPLGAENAIYRASPATAPARKPPAPPSKPAPACTLKR